MELTKSGDLPGENVPSKPQFGSSGLRHGHFLVSMPCVHDGAQHGAQRVIEDGAKSVTFRKAPFVPKVHRHMGWIWCAPALGLNRGFAGCFGYSSPILAWPTPEGMFGLLSPKIRVLDRPCVGKENCNLVCYVACWRGKFGQIAPVRCSLLVACGLLCLWSGSYYGYGGEGCSNMHDPRLLVWLNCV